MGSGRAGVSGEPPPSSPATPAAKCVPRHRPDTRRAGRRGKRGGGGREARGHPKLLSLSLSPLPVQRRLQGGRVGGRGVGHARRRATGKWEAGRKEKSLFVSGRKNRPARRKTRERERTPPPPFLVRLYLTWATPSLPPPTTAPSWARSRRGAAARGRPRARPRRRCRGGRGRDGADDGRLRGA